MDNTRVEQLIKRNSNGTVLVSRIMCIIAALFLIYFGFWALETLGLFVAVGVIYAVVYFFKMTDVEYEYLLLGTELSIDVIYGKSKRKHASTFNVQEAEMFAPITSGRMHNYLHNEKIMARNYTSGVAENNEKVYVLVINNKSQMYKIFIEPNEQLFEGIKSYIPRKTYTD